MCREWFRCLAGALVARRVCAAGAGLALLAAAAGCYDGIRRTVRQGAFGLFEDAVSALYADVGSALLEQIDNIDADPGTYTGARP